VLMWITSKWDMLKLIRKIAKERYDSKEFPYELVEGYVKDIQAGVEPCIKLDVFRRECLVYLMKYVAFCVGPGCRKAVVEWLNNGKQKNIVLIPF